MRIRLLAALAAVACSFGAWAQECILSGVTDQYTYFVAVDATDFTSRETGLATWTVYRSRNGAAAAAFTTPTINETDTTNMPGVYELLLDEDMTIDSGDDVQHMTLHITHAGMAPVTKEICIRRAKVTAGETLTVSSGTGNAAVQSAAANSITASALDTDAVTEINAAILQALGVNVTTIAGLTNQTTFALTAGSADDNAYNDWGVLVIDQSTSAQRAFGIINDYTGATKEVTLRADPGIFTMATGDTVVVMPASLAANVTVGTIEGTDASDYFDGLVSGLSTFVPATDEVYIGGMKDADSTCEITIDNTSPPDTTCADD